MEAISRKGCNNKTRRTVRLVLCLCKLFALLLSITIPGFARSQDTVTADGLFTAARVAAFEHKDFNEGIRLARKALLINPAYTDILVFTGRLYTWNKQPDSGRVYLEAALKDKQPPEDAYMAYSDLEFWNNNNDAALNVTMRGVQRYAGSQELLIREARILSALKRYKEATEVTDTLLIINKTNAEARALNADIRALSYKNKLAFKYDYTHFDKQFVDDWYFAYLEYTRITGIGPLIFRVNYANRFKQDGALFEAEAYPRLSQRFYMYLNAGYSNQVGVFPQWRGGVSLFANLPRAFEAEGGARYLHYSSDIFFYTAYLGKYYKSFLFGARTYLTPDNNKVSNAYIGTVRYYYGAADDYINLNAGFGISPDDRQQTLLNSNNSNLRNYTGELIFRHTVWKLNVVSLNISLLNEEYLPGITGNQLQVGFEYVRHL